MHYIIPAHSAKPLEELKAQFPQSMVYTDHIHIDTALRHTGLNRLTAQVKDTLSDPVTGLLNVWGAPAHGVDAWTDTFNIWITYQYVHPESIYAKYYHLKTVFNEWHDMVKRDGLNAPSADDTPFKRISSRYLHNVEGPNSFSILYDYSVPKSRVELLRVWFKRRGPGTGVKEWEVSHLTGPLRKKYAHLIGWSI
jgi:hypothetical protein